MENVINTAKHWIEVSVSVFHTMMPTSISSFSFIHFLHKWNWLIKNTACYIYLQICPLLKQIFVMPTNNGEK